MASSAITQSLLTGVLSMKGPQSSSGFHWEELYTESLKSKTETPACDILHLENESGTGQTTLYHVFPGIHMAYNDVHMGYCGSGCCNAEHVIEINHCRQGRFECDFGGQTCCYMTPGHLAVCTPKHKKTSACFPLCHYCGISVFLDLQAITPDLNSVFRLLSIDLEPISDLVFRQRQIIVVRAEQSIEQIFSELYSVRDSGKPGYLKVKVLELLLLLSDLNAWEPLNSRVYLNRGHVQAVKAVHAYMMEHMEAHVTISELALQFKLSPTALKSGFKAVYGSSVYAWLRAYRLQTAMQMLNDTTLSIAEIGAKIGYENPNKFSSAFKKKYQLSPSKYRKTHT